MGTPKSVNCCFLASQLSFPTSSFFSVTKWRYDGTFVRAWDTGQSGAISVRPMSDGFISIGGVFSSNVGVVKRFDNYGNTLWESDFKELETTSATSGSVSLINRYLKYGTTPSGDSFVSGRVSTSDEFSVAKFSADGTKSTPSWASSLAWLRYGFYVSQWSNAVVAHVNNPDYDPLSPTSETNFTTLLSVVDSSGYQIQAVANTLNGSEGRMLPRIDLAPDNSIWGEAWYNSWSGSYVANFQHSVGYAANRSYISLPYALGSPVSSYHFSTPDNGLVYIVNSNPRMVYKLKHAVNGFVYPPFPLSVNPWTVEFPGSVSLSYGGCADDNGNILFIVNDGSIYRIYTLDKDTGDTTAISPGWFRIPVNCLFADGEYLWMGHGRSSIRNLVYGVT